MPEHDGSSLKGGYGDRKDAKKIISGGQTGADIAALDWALENSLPHGGWCPQGRRMEAGSIDAKYQLSETPSDKYLQRTKWNVRDSDGTVIFSLENTLTGGSKKTVQFAIKLKKPWLHISQELPLEQVVSALQEFITQNDIQILNVAGPRASKAPGISPFVKTVLGKALATP